MAWNQSRVKQFRRCQKQYSFRYDYAEKMGLDPDKEMVPKIPSVPLKRGSWMHALQEAHHREWAGVDGEGWEDVQQRLVKAYDGLFDEEKETLGDLPRETRRMFRAYLRRWNQHDADRYQVATLHDGSPAVEFLVEVSLRKWGVVEPFKGTIDLLVEDLEYGGLWVWDAKWVKRIPDSDDRMMATQNLMYVWALRKLGYDIRGFLYNYGRTKPPTIPHPVYGGKQLSVAKKIDTTYEIFLAEMVKLHGAKGAKQLAKTLYRDRLAELKARSSLWFRRERIPVTPERIRVGLAEFIVSVRDIERRNTKFPPRTWEGWRCSYCDYKDICVAEFNGLDIEPLIKAKYTFEDERYESGEAEEE